MVSAGCAAVTAVTQTAVRRYYVDDQSKTEFRRFFIGLDSSLSVLYFVFIERQHVDSATAIIIDINLLIYIVVVVAFY